MFWNDTERDDGRGTDAEGADARAAGVAGGDARGSDAEPDGAPDAGDSSPRDPRPDGGAVAVEREEAVESDLDGDRSEDPAGADRDATSDGPGAPELDGQELVVGYPSADEPVLDGETVRLAPGEVTALVGPNGSGKSTLLKSIARQLDVDAGRVLLDDRDVHQMGSGEFARAVGLLSQEHAAPESLTVEELVGHGRYPHRGFFESLSAEDREAIDRAIDLAGVDHLRDREVRTLSGGQRQLVWIAMALAQETDVLLLDEPTTFLDLHHQLEVMEIVETLRDRSDVTVGLVLHDVEQAARYADRVVALRDGEVVDAGTPEDVVTEELLAEVFGIAATVTPTDRGPRITPEAAIHPDGEGHGAAAASDGSDGTAGGAELDD